MLKAVAAAAAMNHELDRLSGRAVQTSRATQRMAQDNDNLARSANSADRGINQLTGRLRVMADVAAILGPTLAPIGAVGAAGIAGLANQFGVAALAGGTAIMAFQGVGDTLKAVNTAALEPTAENLDKARVAMEAMSPAARDMVRELQSLRPVLTGLRDAGAEGLFPGVIDGLDALESRLPDVERIVSHVSSTLGMLARDAGEDLASDRWDEFFAFLATDATTTLSSLGRTVGKLTHGMAELWMAFDPLNDDFSNWLEDVATGFDSWSTGLDQTQGFQEFIDYVRTSGPQVEDTFAALANAVLQIAEAAAPLGGPILHALEVVANVVATIADSDLGTPIMMAVTAMALLSRAQGTYRALSATTWGGAARANVLGMASAITTVTSAQDRARLSAKELLAVEAKRTAAIRGGLGTLAKGAGAMAALALATSGAADSMGLSNTAVFGLVGGPMGAAVGLTLDLADATGDLSRAVDEANDAMDSGSVDQMREKYRQLLDELDASDVKSSLLAQFDIGAQLDRLGSGDFSGLLKSGPLGGFINAIRGQSGEAIDTLDELKHAIYDATHPDTGTGLRGLFGDLGVTESAFDHATQSATEFRDSLIKVNAALDGRSNMRDYEAALDDYRKALDKAKKAGKDFLTENGKGFNIDKGVGRDLEAALDSIASSSLAAAENLHRMDRVHYLEQARKDFIAAARDAHIPLQAARALADEFGLVNQINAHPRTSPEGIPETHRALDDVDRHFGVIDKLFADPKVDVDDHASGPLSWVESALNRIDGQHATATVTTIRETINRITNAPGNVAANLFGSSDADGSIHEYYASGGLRAFERWPRIGNQPPQIRPYSGRRGITWGEEGSGPWEAFISGHPNKVSRSRSIADEVVARLGGQVQWMAAGGLMQRARVPAHVVAGPRRGGSTSVVVGGPRVQVFIDGREVRATVRSEMGSQRRYEERLNDRE